MEKQIQEKMSPQLQATRQIAINLSVTNTGKITCVYTSTHTQYPIGCGFCDTQLGGCGNGPMFSDLKNPRRLL